MDKKREILAIGITLAVVIGVIAIFFPTLQEIYNIGTIEENETSPFWEEIQEGLKWIDIYVGDKLNETEIRNIEVTNIYLEEGPFMCCDAVITVRNNNNFGLAGIVVTVNYTGWFGEEQGHAEEYAIKPRETVNLYAMLDDAWHCRDVDDYELYKIVAMKFNESVEPDYNPPEALGRTTY